MSRIEDRNYHELIDNT
uniref:Uncharacterized protein n=1 Tax=Moniliophthora roreri TaxID=221103 RepID=A0A0W0EZ27_MONRR